MKVSIVAIVLGVLVCTATAENFRIGAYNLQSFATNKWEMVDEGEDEDGFMFIQFGLSKILSRMDLVLLQEIQDNCDENRVTEEMKTYLNRPDLKLSRAIVETEGRYFKGHHDNRGERYAYVYDDEKFELMEFIEPANLWAHLHLNENVQWDRPPFVAKFKFKDEGLRANVPSFWVIGIHVTYVKEQRSESIAREIANLLKVAGLLKNPYVIILGDFNAGALSKTHAAEVEKKYNNHFKLMTGNLGNTMSHKTGKAHDRIYFSNELVGKLEEQHYTLDAGKQETGIVDDETQEIILDMCHLSDHLPVWVDMEEAMEEE